MEQDEIEKFLKQLPHSDTCGACGVKNPGGCYQGMARGIYCRKAWFCSMKCYHSIKGKAACCGRDHN